MSTSTKSTADGKDAAKEAASQNRAEKDTARPDALKLRGDAFVARIKELINESTVQRIVVKNEEGQTVMEIPMAAGFVAAVAAPVVTAVSAIAAMANHWKIEVYRKEQ
ncbi:DUF4342 domain-containing protein [Pseudonocardia sp. GCM10023141]|uniref:DUF4342 domain-containing protein n=1 Tax=Pseudonocardia sp. GCM10023141 TaxID=3252653 RepID=UPI00361B954E